MRPLVYGLLALLVALAATPAPAPGGTYDPNGIFWDGWLGREPADDPYSQTGTMTTSMTTATTGTWTWVGSNSEGTNPLVLAGAITSLGFDANRWAYMDTALLGDPNYASQPVLAFTQDTYVSVGRDANQPAGLGINVGLRKPLGLYEANDLVGTWAYLSQSIGLHEAEFSWGFVDLLGPDANGYLTFQTDFRDANGSPIADDNAWGTWSYSSPTALLTVEVRDPNNPGTLWESFSLPVGKGRMIAQFEFTDHVADSNSAQDLELLWKLGNGRTLSELTGEWLLNALLSDANGQLETYWGELVINADGNFVMGATSSAGNTELAAGYATVENDGKVALWDADSNDLLFEGYLNLGGDLIVFGMYDRSYGGVPGSVAMGAIIASRAVPEPASLAVAAVAAGWLLRRRRSRR